jgi:CrcB protein
MLHALVICLGACVGALLRWQLGLWLSTPGQLPWGTLAANALGGYLIGFILAWLHAHPQLDPVWRLLLVTGFLGALTTFSSYSAEVFALLQAQRWGMALLWAGAHIVASLLLTAAGWQHAQSWLQRGTP